MKVTERWFHLNDVCEVGKTPSNEETSYLDVRGKADAEDYINALTLSKTYAIFALLSGTLLVYSLPDFKLLYILKIFKDTEIINLAINNDNSQVAILDFLGNVRILKLPEEAPKTEQEENDLVLNFQWKDCWSFKWADDHPNMFCLMDKTRLYTFLNYEPQENFASSGYICEYNNLQVFLSYLILD
jgi:hypothetical protein